MPNGKKRTLILLLLWGIVYFGVSTTTKTRRKMRKWNEIDEKKVPNHSRFSSTIHERAFRASKSHNILQNNSILHRWTPSIYTIAATLLRIRCSLGVHVDVECEPCVLHGKRHTHTHLMLFALCVFDTFESKPHIYANFTKHQRHTNQITQLFVHFPLTVWCKCFAELTIWFTDCFNPIKWYSLSLLPFCFLGKWFWSHPNSPNTHTHIQSLFLSFHPISLYIEQICLVKCIDQLDW